LNPDLFLLESWNNSTSNIIFAVKTPMIAPKICKSVNSTNVLKEISLFKKNARDTTGLKWLLYDSNDEIKK